MGPGWGAERAALALARSGGGGRRAPVAAGLDPVPRRGSALACLLAAGCGHVCARGQRRGAERAGRERGEPAESTRVLGR